MTRQWFAALALVLAGCAAGEPTDAERALDAAVHAEIAAHPDDYSNGDARAVTVSRNGQLHGLIWGTMHTGYNDSTIPPAFIRAKLAEAADLTVETVYDDRTTEQTRQLFTPCTQAARHPDPAAFERLDSDVRTAVAGLRLANGKAEDYSLLSLSYAVAAQSADLSRTALPSGSSPDIVLTRVARDRHIPIYSLERPETQVAMLCSDPNGPVAAMQLRRAVHLRRDISEIRRYIRSSYEAGHVSYVLASAYWLADKEDLDALLIQRKQLFGSRNRRMAERISNTLEAPGLHFIAVGAGHLIGRDGLVTRLQQDGWTIAPCQNDRC